MPSSPARPLRRPLALVLLGCLLLVPLAACAVNPTDTAGASESPAQFSAEAGKDCTGANLTALGGTAPYTAAQYGTIQTTLVDLRRLLDALVPPAAMQQDVFNLLGGYSTVANAAASATKDLASGQTPEQVQAPYATAVATPLATIATAAQSIDAAVCGQIPIGGH